MKVALLFCGQPRFIDGQSYSTIMKHIISKYDTDIYAHFWFEKGCTYHTAPWSGLGDIKLPDNSIELFKDLYNPIAIEYDPPIENNNYEEKYKNTHHPIAPYNLISCYTSMKKVVEVFEKNKKCEYDFLIKIRSDLILNAMPDLYKLSKEHIYVPKIIDNYAMDNVIWIAKEENFKILMKIIDIFDILANNGVFVNDEQMFYASVKYNNLLEYIIPGNFNFEAVRS